MRSAWQDSIITVILSQLRKLKRSNQSRGTTGASTCRTGIKILTGIWRQHSCCEMTKPGEGARWRWVSCSHHSRLTSTNRYTTCGDSIRKPLATDRLWANSCLGGVQKWEGSVYKDKITQWNPTTCSTKTGGCLTWRRGGQTLPELRVWFQANKSANTRRKTLNATDYNQPSHVFMTWEDKDVDGAFIYDQKNVWASLFWLKPLVKYSLKPPWKQPSADVLPELGNFSCITRTERVLTCT